MKRILLILTFLASAFCYADTFKIIKLSSSPVIIGGKEKTVNSTFKDTDIITWKYDKQGMWVSDESNGGYRYFSKEAFKAAGVNTAFSYLKTNHPSTRGGFELLPYTKAAYNSEKRFALVVGNSNYRYEKSLRNPIADATDIADNLRALGFDVLITYDADYNTMNTALEKFKAASQGYATTLFYFAGHGQQYKGQTYLLPIDANVCTEYDIRNMCVPGPRVVSFMNEVKANTNIAIIDACRSDMTLLRDTGNDELRMDAPDNGIVLFSTKGGEPASDGEGNHSPFADALLNCMIRENLSLQDFVIQVTREVKNRTASNDSQQVPNSMSSLDHGFYFNFNSSSLTTPTTTSGDDAIVSSTDQSESLSNSKPTFSSESKNNIIFNILPGKYKDFKILSKEYLGVEKNNKWGVVDNSGNVVVPFNYSSIYFSGGLFHVVKNHSQGCIDQNGNFVFPLGNQMISRAQEDYQVAIIKNLKNYKCGLFDYSGNTILPYIYDHISPFYQGLAVVSSNEKSGYVALDGSLVLPFSYDTARPFNENGLAPVSLNNKWGFIDSSGTFVIPCKYEDCYSFFNGLARVKQDDKWGFIDNSDNLVVPFMYDYASSFTDGLAIVKQEGKYGFIDITGKYVIPCQYDYIEEFHDELSLVKSNGKFGFIDIAGNVVIHCSYSKAYSFCCDRALVCVNGKYGFIDKKGNMVIPCIYERAHSFDEEYYLAKVWLDGKPQYIDVNGITVIQ